MPSALGQNLEIIEKGQCPGNCVLDISSPSGLRLSMQIINDSTVLVRLCWEAKVSKISR